MLRKNFSKTYKLSVILIIFTGLWCSFKNANSIISKLSYYTIQSNIICLALFTYSLIFEILDLNYKTKNYYIIKGGIIIAIILTGVIYHIALLPGEFQMDASTKIIKVLSSILLHGISPIIVLVDYILFDKKGKFKYKYAIYWLAFPIYYVIYVYIYSYFGGEFYNIGGSKNYAYIFLDFKKIGIINVEISIISIIIFLILISYILIAYDHKKKDHF